MCCKKNESVFKKELKTWLWALLIGGVLVALGLLQNMIGVYFNG